MLSYRDIVGHILDVTGKRRFLLPLPMGMARPLSRIFLSWWYWPAVSRYFMDRFFVSDVTYLDSVQRQFDFRPARFSETITYLNRPGMRRRLFRH